MITIGVSIAIPQPWGRQLQDYRIGLGDRADGIPTHITLIGPATLPRADIDQVCAHLAQVADAARPFDIHLRGTDTFRPVSPVVYVTVAEGADGCESLATALRSGPLAVDLIYPYHPHVTIAHELGEDALDRAQREMSDFECRFSVDAFSLYTYTDDLGWTPSRDFTLGNRPAIAGTS